MGVSWLRVKKKKEVWKIYGMISSLDTSVVFLADKLRHVY